MEDFILLVREGDTLYRVGVKAESVHKAMKKYYTGKLDRRRVTSYVYSANVVAKLKKKHNNKVYGLGV